ncbi:SRPBCC family protein [Streptomyces sp. NPDC048641]|uniref:SRPBCC family protein n=1 Tax=unclassified Streptomyces TaxID=2593676 RepID=UPI00342BEEF0
MATTTTATATIDLRRPADDVWKLIGGFDSLPDWLPYITRSELSEGGRVRHLTNQDGGVIVERLKAFDHDNRTYSYAIEQAPFPVTGYLSTLTVRDVPGAPGTSRVEWTGSFTPVGVSEAEAEELFHGIYADGLAALRKTVNT